MLTISHTSCGSTGELLDRSLDTVEFYGFEQLDAHLKKCKPTRSVKVLCNPTFAHPSEKKLTGVTKRLISHGYGRHSEPRFMYNIEQGPKVAALGLHAVGSRSAIAESMLIATLATLARESGLSDYTLHINSLGDKESSLRYMRELTNFLRNNLNDMPAYAREEMQAGNPAKAFSRLVEKQHESIAHAPSPMEFLNDESRAHLRSVLEYTESVGVPYELNTNLIGSNDCWLHTIFELHLQDENGNDITIARGGRHNTLAQKSFRVDLPIVSAVLEHEVQGRTKAKRRTKREPKFFFAQLGPYAKMRSFNVLENLRTAGVPIAQQLAVESIGGQLEHAEKNSVPYVIIIGHKEALEESAIVRNMLTRSQTVVPLSTLPGYLRRLRVA